VNPPELSIAEDQIKKVKHGRFVLLPISDLTHGHATHSYPTAWKQYLAELLEQTKQCFDGNNRKPYGERHKLFTAT